MEQATNETVQQTVSAETTAQLAEAVIANAGAVQTAAVKKVEAIRSEAFNFFVSMLPQLRGGMEQKVFRRAINTHLETKFKINHNSACSAYNHAKLKATELGLVNVGVIELGRPPEKNNGGRKAKAAEVAVVLEVATEQVVVEQQAEAVVEEATPEVVVEQQAEAVVEEATPEVVVEQQAEAVVEEATPEVVVEQQAEAVVEEATPEVATEQEAVATEEVAVEQPAETTTMEIHARSKTKRRKQVQ